MEATLQLPLCRGEILPATDFKTSISCSLSFPFLPSTSFYLVWMVRLMTIPQTGLGHALNFGGSRPLVQVPRAMSMKQLILK